MIYLVKLTHVVGSKSIAEIRQEVLELVTFLELKDDNIMVSRVTLENFTSSDQEHEVVREFVITRDRLNDIFELCAKGEDPTKFVVGEEQKYLNKYLMTP